MFTQLSYALEANPVIGIIGIIVLCLLFVYLLFIILGWR